MSGPCEVEDGVTEYCRGCGKLKREHPGYPYRKLGIGFLVRTTQDAGSNWPKSGPVNHPRKDCQWNEIGRVDSISNIKHATYRVNHASYVREGVRIVQHTAWYEREELELAVSDPHAWLLAGLVLRWNPQDAKVLADACEERGNHGAASLLREDLCLKTRQVIESLAMIMGIKAFDESPRNTWQSSTDYRIGWSHDLNMRPFEEWVDAKLKSKAALVDRSMIVTGSDGRVLSPVTGRIATVHQSYTLAIDGVRGGWMGRPVVEGSVLRVTNEAGAPVAGMNIYLRIEQ